MEKMVRSVTAIAVCFALVACATTPVPLAQARPVPQDRLYAFQKQSTQNSAVLLVVRDKGFGGSACHYAFYINNELSARFDTGEKATFYVKPGEVLLRYGRDPMGSGLCGTMKQQWSTHETIIKPGESKDFRVTLDASGRPIVQRSY